MAKGCYPLSPLDETVPHRESRRRISGVIAKLREGSPYFVLEECHILRDQCAFVRSKTSYLTLQQLMGFITFGGKEFVMLKWSNKKQEEWVEKSVGIQEQQLSEQKHQKPKVLTSSKIGALSDTHPKEKKMPVTVLSDKQQESLIKIY